MDRTTVLAGRARTTDENTRHIIIERVARLLAGDKAAFDGRLYQALYARGRTIISWSIACPARRGHLLQDAIFRFWKALEHTKTFRGPEEDAPAYYDMIVRNLRKDYVKKRTLVISESEPDSDHNIGNDPEEDAIEPVDEIIEQEVLIQLRQCKSRLPGLARRLVEQWANGISKRELAKVHGKPYHAVKSLLDKACYLIAACLARKGVKLDGEPA